jgi:hypothetical protein
MYKDRTNNLFIFEFNSINELVNYCQTAPINTEVFGSRPSSITGSSSFTETESWEKALEMITNGWEEGYQKVLSKLNTVKVNTNTKNHKFQEQISVDGYAPCVPRAIIGHPETMFQSHTIPFKHKIVDVFVQNANSCSVGAETIIKVGIIACNYINEIESKGYRTNLYSMESKSSGAQNSIYITKVKDSREQLSLKRIVFPLAHASMLRRLYFRVLESSGVDKHWSDGYGQPNDKLGRDYVQRKFPKAFMFPSQRSITLNSSDTPMQYLEKVWDWNGFKVE